MLSSDRRVMFPWIQDGLFIKAQTEKHICICFRVKLRYNKAAIIHSPIILTWVNIKRVTLSHKYVHCISEKSMVQ